MHTAEDTTEVLVVTVEVAMAELIMVEQEDMEVEIMEELTMVVVQTMVVVPIMEVVLDIRVPVDHRHLPRPVKRVVNTNLKPLKNLRKRQRKNLKRKLKRKQKKKAKNLLLTPNEKCLNHTLLKSIKICRSIDQKEIEIDKKINHLTHSQ